MNYNRLTVRLSYCTWQLHVHLLQQPFVRLSTEVTCIQQLASLSFGPKMFAYSGLFDVHTKCMSIIVMHRWKSCVWRRYEVYSYFSFCTNLARLVQQLRAVLTTCSTILLLRQLIVPKFCYNRHSELLNNETHKTSIIET